MEIPCPSYCRSANVVNNTQSHVHVTITYESQQVDSYPLPAGDKVDIEKVIDHGSFQTTDPIVHVHVRCDQLCDEVVEAVQAESIEHHEYTVVANESDKLEIIKGVVLD